MSSANRESCKHFKLVSPKRVFTDNSAIQAWLYVRAGITWQTVCAEQEVRDEMQFLQNEIKSVCCQKKQLLSHRCLVTTVGVFYTLLRNYINFMLFTKRMAACISALLHYLHGLPVTQRMRFDTFFPVLSWSQWYKFVINTCPVCRIHLHPFSAALFCF